MITILTKIKTKTIKEMFCYLKYIFLNEIIFLSNIKIYLFHSCQGNISHSQCSKITKTNTEKIITII